MAGGRLVVLSGTGLRAGSGFSAFRDEYRRGRQRDRRDAVDGKSARTGTGGDADVGGSGVGAGYLRQLSGHSRRPSGVGARPYSPRRRCGIAGTGRFADHPFQPESPILVPSGDATLLVRPRVRSPRSRPRLRHDSPARRRAGGGLLRGSRAEPIRCDLAERTARHSG